MKPIHCTEWFKATPTTTSSTNPSFVGSFPLQVQGGVGQILTIQVTSTTEFEGDGVTGLSGDTALQSLAQATFVEVDAIVDTSGNIIAQEVDAEEQSVTTGQHAGSWAEIIGVTRDNSGNATGFNLLVGREAWDMTSEVPLHSSLAVTLADTTNYWSNWHHWNRHSLQFGPQTVGLAEDVAVYGVLTAATTGSFHPCNARRRFCHPAATECAWDIPTVAYQRLGQYDRWLHHAAVRGALRGANDHGTDLRR